MLSVEQIHALWMEIGEPGRSSLISGERGQGKTALGMWLSEWLRTHNTCQFCKANGDDPQGWWILSNVIIIQKDSVAEEEDESYPPRWIKVRSFSELNFQIGKIRSQDRKAKILWFVDEGAASFSIYDSVFTKKNRTLIKFLTLARKLGIANITVTLSPKLVHKQLRSVSGGFLAVVLRKEGKLILDRAKHVLNRGVDERSVCILQWPEVSETAYEILVINTAAEDSPTIAQPYYQVPDGERVFDTEAAASFDIGTMIGASHKPFHFEKYLSWISDCPSSKVPSRILEYFRLEGEVEVEIPLDLLQPESVVKGTEQWGREVVLPVVIEELPALLDEGVRSNRQLAARLIEILKDRGIPTSEQRLRKSYIPMAKERLLRDNPDLIEQIGDTLR